MVDARARRIPSSLSLHTANCDKLYRWAMWRIYINEDMSRKISDWRDFGDRTASVNSVALPYLKHPDSCKYGRLMRKRFGKERDTIYYRDRLKLTDSQYLVYGIPRVSLAKNIPTDLVRLYKSCPDFPSSFETVDEKSVENANEELVSQTDVNQRQSMGNESDQITELFKFVSFENTPNTSPQASGAELKSSTTNEIATSNHNETEITNIDNIVSDSVDKERLVTRSKVFWKKLAQRRQDIIELGIENDEHEEAETPVRAHQDHVISSDILLKQQKLLKATPKPKPNKDMWRSLADRKTEILKMSDNVKHKESKSNSLWNFIASKKNELLHIKRGSKRFSEIVGGKNDNSKAVTALNQESAQLKADSVPKAVDFQDSFQQELEAKLRQRRNRIQPDQEEI